MICQKKEDKVNMQQDPLLLGSTQHPCVSPSSAYSSACYFSTTSSAHPGRTPPPGAAPQCVRNKKTCHENGEYIHSSLESWYERKYPLPPKKVFSLLERKRALPTWTENDPENHSAAAEPLGLSEECRFQAPYGAIKTNSSGEQAELNCADSDAPRTYTELKRCLDVCVEEHGSDPNRQRQQQQITQTHEVVDKQNIFVQNNGHSGSHYISDDKVSHSGSHYISDDKVGHSGSHYISDDKVGHSGSHYISDDKVGHSGSHYISDDKVGHSGSHYISDDKVGHSGSHYISDDKVGHSGSHYISDDKVGHSGSHYISDDKVSHSGSHYISDDKVGHSGSHYISDDKVGHSGSHYISDDKVSHSGSHYISDDKVGHSGSHYISDDKPGYSVADQWLVPSPEPYNDASGQNSINSRSENDSGYATNLPSDVDSLVVSDESPPQSQLNYYDWNFLAANKSKKPSSLSSGSYLSSISSSPSPQVPDVVDACNASSSTKTEKTVFLDNVNSSIFKKKYFLVPEDKVKFESSLLSKVLPLPKVCSPARCGLIAAVVKKGASGGRSELKCGAVNDSECMSDKVVSPSERDGSYLGRKCRHSVDGNSDDRRPSSDGKHSPYDARHSSNDARHSADGTTDGTHSSSHNKHLADGSSGGRHSKDGGKRGRHSSFDGKHISNDDKHSADGERHSGDDDDPDEPANAPLKAEVKIAQWTSTAGIESDGLCQVCGDVAAGFYCGAFICEACKKFFVRTCKQEKVKYVCHKNQKCKITKENRIRCQYCRYQKCLSVNMCNPSKQPSDCKPDVSNIPCRVCGGPSSGFHFGALTCEGCKGFFRRMVKERSPNTYQCPKDNKCDINTFTRNICKSCRYRKCIEVGMSVQGSRIGRQPNSVKHAISLEAKHLKPAGSHLPKTCFTETKPEITDTVMDASSKPDDDEVPVEQPFVNIKQEPLSFPEDMKALQSDLRLATKTFSKLTEEGFTTDISKLSSMEGAWDQMMNHLELSAKCIITFAKKVPGFKSLVMEDQVLLMQLATYPILLLNFACQYDVDKGDNASLGFTRAEEKMLIKFFPKLDILPVHHSHIGFMMKHLGIDSTELAIMCALMLFCDDSPVLKENWKVMQWHDYYIECLQEYTQSAYQDGETRFGVLLLRLGELSVNSLQLNKTINAILSSNPHLQVNILFKEIFTV